MTVDFPLPVGLAAALFSQLPGVAYFAKDSALRYVSANAVMCDMCGKFERDLLGRRSFEFFSWPNASRGEKAELEILATKRPGREAISNIVGRGGRSQWLVVRRWPILDARGHAAGVVGLGRILPGGAKQSNVYRRVADALEHINAGFRESLEVQAVARSAGLSVDRLEREFDSIFDLSPRDYITKVRMEAASERLLLGDNIAEVAQSCGYSDQSAFARRFRQLIGMSPSEFRRRYSVED